jgi:hypothetical protein
MTDETQLRALLHHAAADIDSDLTPPPVDQFRTRLRTRRRGALSVAGAVAAVLALVLVITLTRPGAQPHTAHLPPQPTAGVSIAQLKTGHWTALPQAPIAGRLDAASTWTGTQMLVWGGSPTGSNNKADADGAAFNPTTRSWARLPVSPLTARLLPESVWTGSDWFIWGGYGPSNPNDQLLDGALFNPTTHTWTTVAPSPIHTITDIAAVWTGTKIIFFTTDRVAAQSIHATAYTPSTNTWTTLPDLTLPARHALTQLVVLQTGTQTLVWSEWDRSIPLGHDSFTGEAGVDSFTFNGTSDTWIGGHSSHPEGSAVNGALWTGSHVLIPVAVPVAVGHGPRRTGQHGELIDPDTGRTKQMTHGPLNDDDAKYLWTGNALIAYDTNPGTNINAKTRTIPGDAALWNPNVNTWTRLAAAPTLSYDSGENATVWTGTHLITWGVFSRWVAPSTQDETSPDARPTTHGYQFG